MGGLHGLKRQIEYCKYTLLCSLTLFNRLKNSVKFGYIGRMIIIFFRIEPNPEVPPAWKHRVLKWFIITAVLFKQITGWILTISDVKSGPVTITAQVQVLYSQPHEVSLRNCNHPGACNTSGKVAWIPRREKTACVSSQGNNIVLMWIFARSHGGWNKIMQKNVLKVFVNKYQWTAQSNRSCQLVYFLLPVSSDKTDFVGEFGLDGERTLFHTYSL